MEADFLLEYSLKNKKNILVLEKLYPFFKRIRYVSIEKNYLFLKQKIAFLQSKKIPLKKFSTICSNTNMYKVERKIRNKSKLDNYFSAYPLYSYQEVFKLKENREDRVVIALDYNSMFPSFLINELFFDPKYLKYKFINKQLDLIESMENGLYNVELSSCNNEIIKKFHYFIYRNNEIGEQFNIEDGKISTLLFGDEIEFLKEFFSIFIVDAIICTKQIKHPLSKEAKQLFSERMQYKRNHNIDLEAMTKSKLTLLHSCTNIKQFKTIRFKQRSELINHLSHNFCLKDMVNNDFIEYLIKKNKLYIYSDGSSNYARYIDNNSPLNIHSLSAQVVSKAKLKMLKTINELSKMKDLDICYINIDSIHVSIKRKDLSLFWYKYADLISNDLGKMKVEAIADRGVWLDIGRYWLYKDEKAVLYRNILFNRPYLNNPFIKKTTIKKIVKFHDFHYIENIRIKLIDCLRMHKKLNLHNDHIDIIRFNQSDFIDLNIYKKSKIENLSQNIDVYERIIRENFG